jgi:hypothetical protein
MTTSTRINAFLWNRVSQGYTRVVKDKPPFESWRAWRAGHRNHKPVLYLTPASSPARELRSELDGVSAAGAAVAVAGPSSSRGAGGYGTTTGVRTVTAPRTLAAAAGAASTATSYSESAASGSRRGVGVVVAGVTGANGPDSEDGDEEAEEEELEFEYEDVKVLTTALTGPPSSQEWPLPFSSFGSQESQLSSQGTSWSTSTSGSGQERFRKSQISFQFHTPEDMMVAAVQCTLTRRVEDVKNSSKHGVPPSHNFTVALPLDSLFRTETEVCLREESFIRCPVQKTSLQG